MTSKERIELTKGEWFRHFIISILLLIPIIICVYYWFVEAEDLYLFPIVIFVALSIFFFLGNWKRLFFQKYKADLTDEQFIKIVKITAIELNWRISKIEGSYAKAFRVRGILEDNASEKITIKKRNGVLFINSIGNSGIVGQRNYSKRNKENVDSFLLNAKAILQGESVEEVIIERQKRKEEEFWAESEWTIGRTLKRIIGYGLVLIFTSIGLFFLLYEDDRREFDDIGGILAIIFSVAIGFHYIKNDISILREKRRRRNKRTETD